MKSEAAEASLRAPALVGGSGCWASIAKRNLQQLSQSSRAKATICLILGNLENFAPATCCPRLCCPTSNPMRQRKGKAAERTLAKPNTAALAVQEHFNLGAFSRDINQDQQVPH